MRRFSKQYVLVDGEKYYLVSVKEEYGGWSPISLFGKSEEKDEFGFIVEDQLFCPHRDKLSHLAWWPLPSIWLNVQDICKECWGSHRTPDSRFDCILRSKQINQYRNGEAMGIDKPREAKP